MKIIQITTFYKPVTGGVEVQVEEISEILKKLGNEVKIFTTNSDRNNSKIRNSKSEINGIEVHRFNTWFSLSQFHKFAPGMFFQLMNEDFDILHVHGWRKIEVYLALLAAKLKGKKVVVTTHNPFTTNTRTENLTTFIKLHDATFGKWFSKYIDKTICLLSSEIEIVHDKFNVTLDKISVIPNGISDSFFERYKIQDTRYKQIQNPKSKIPNINELLKLNVKENYDHIVLTASRLNVVKGLQNLKVAADKLPNVLFLMVGGDDGYKTELMELYKNNMNVIITGEYISREDLSELYKQVDIFLLPSLHEPFGLTPVEAAASGLPVIATNVGGPKEVLNGIGIFIDPTDQNGWYENIRDLLQYNNKRNILAENGKLIAEKYRWKNVIEKIEKVYKSL